MTEDALREYGVQSLGQIVILETRDLRAAGMSKAQSRRLQQMAMEAPCTMQGTAGS